jgi:hydroxymethylpyrimidine/phosphomethylpyrimidine kinase
MKVVLSIAGSDPCAGAGIQADLKTFAAHGVYGLTVVSAITAQNTVAVQTVEPLPARLVTAQLASVLADIKIDAVKIGLLPTAEIVTAVATEMAGHGLEKLVVDPVLASGGGCPLVDEEAVAALKEKLLPLALLVTPNLAEASVLAGLPVDSMASMREAALRIYALGPRFVLIKGGHLAGEATDLLYNGTTFHEYRGPRAADVNVHGTGCTLASAIAAQLALGRSMQEAIGMAKAYVYAKIANAVCLGQGQCLMP